jgi:hypothetical protein
MNASTGVASASHFHLRRFAGVRQTTWSPTK